MRSPSSIQFIDTALSCSSRFALSYTDPLQKWIIREHLISLLQDFPSLNPSMDTYFHNDGTIVCLLNAQGVIRISGSKPAIPLTIWIHENYPQMPPMVSVSMNSIYTINCDHPFVDRSGVTTSPYLQTWLYHSSNLSGLVHNLVKLFSHNHPFCYSTSSHCLSHPSLVSKMEAMDRLTCTLQYDMVALRSKTEEEIEELSAIQSEMVKRGEITTSLVIGLENERMNLKKSVTDLTNEADVLSNWLKVNGKNSAVTVEGDDDIENAFEGVDNDTKLVLGWLAADKTIEDLMYALSSAVEHGVVSPGVYIKQVRVLAREQFSYRARLLNLKGPKAHQLL